MFSAALKSRFLKEMSINAFNGSDKYADLAKLRHHHCLLLLRHRGCHKVLDPQQAYVLFEDSANVLFDCGALNRARDYNLRCLHEQ